MYQVFGKIGTAAFGLETISASKFCQLTLFSLFALKPFRLYLTAFSIFLIV
jgi:hypothetical protein